MEIQRAIEIIERKTSIPKDGENFEEISEAFDVAIAALEKHIPKKPDLKGYDEQDYYKCPSCGGELASLDDYFPKQLYCADCGQALDWEEGEENNEE